MNRSELSGNGDLRIETDAGFKGIKKHPNFPRCEVAATSLGKYLVGFIPEFLPFVCYDSDYV